MKAVSLNRERKREGVMDGESGESTKEGEMARVKRETGSRLSARKRWIVSLWLS